MNFIPPLLMAVCIPLTLYVVMLLFFALVACFSKKHRKRAKKVLEVLTRVRLRSG